MAKGYDFYTLHTKQGFPIGPYTLCEYSYSDLALTGVSNTGTVKTQKLYSCAYLPGMTFIKSTVCKNNISGNISIH